MRARTMSTGRHALQQDEISTIIADCVRTYNWGLTEHADKAMQPTKNVL